MAEFIFIVSTVLIVYTYLLYPLGIFLLALARGRNRPVDRLPASDLPPVTFVISVFNEENRIAGKVENIRSLDYPQEKIRIVIVSDGSTDNSNQVLEELAEAGQISAIFLDERQGKPNALNIAMSRVDTEVVAFADIRQVIADDALANMISELKSDPAIGLVSSELVHTATDGSTSANVGLYWKYEKWIRHCESDYRSTVGTTGAFYVIHREDYVTLRDDVILDDFEIPMNIVRAGKQAKISKRALIYDSAHDDLGKEKIRKLRTLSGNYQSFLRMKWLFSPGRNPLFLQFVSHKFLRLLIPYFLLSALLANLAILDQSVLYVLTFAIQILFYALALLARFNAKVRSIRVANFCLVFVELNTTVIHALYRYLTNQTQVTWSKT